MDEAQQLLNIFPEEIWELIFEKIEDPNDLERISNSSPFFRNVLQSKRVMFLFAKVWKVLNLKYHSQESIQKKGVLPQDILENDVLQKHCDQCHRWSAKWWYSATVQFRLVCRYWSSSIDKILQVYAEEYKESAVPENAAICVEYFDNLLYVYDNNLEVVDGYLEHFQATHPAGGSRSPALIRSFGVSFNPSEDDEYDDDNDEEDALSETIKLLRNYGHHFWHLNFSGSQYIQLQKVLALLPNLKSLEIVYDDSSVHDLLSVEEKKAQLQNEIQQNPLPIFNHLSNLYLDKLPSLIFNELLKNCKSVSVLEVRKNFQNEVYDLHLIQSPNLQQFEMEIETEDQFQNLKTLQEKWPLQKLSLNVFHLDSKEWSTIFHLLEEKWAETLTTLVLEMPDKRENTVEDIQLKLPKLKSFEMHVGAVCSIDFLFPIKGSLETLNVIGAYYSDREQVKNAKISIESESVVKLLSCSKNLLESNIWNIFPMLKAVRIIETFETEEDPIKDDNQTTKREWREYVKGKLSK